MFSCALLSVVSSFAIISLGKRVLRWCALIAFLMSFDCKCFVSLPHGAMGWSVVCDCGISWSYSLFSCDCAQFNLKKKAHTL